MVFGEIVDFYFLGDISEELIYTWFFLLAFVEGALAAILHPFVPHEFFDVESEMGIFLQGTDH